MFELALDILLSQVVTNIEATLASSGITLLADVFTQGATDVAFTVVDVLGYLDKIPVCVGYEIDGEVTTDFPTTRKLEKAKPVFEVLDGWKSDIRGIKKYEDLPENCKKYIDFVEKHIGFPITMVSNGPKREDIIYRESPLSK